MSQILSDDSEKNQLDMIGMMLGKHMDGTVDTDTMIIKTQERLVNSLEHGIEYDGTVEESDNFLREHVWKKLPMVVMYVDIVGSTQMVLSLPEEKVAMLFSSFTQEMAILIEQNAGMVLKFVGDAVIGYFIDASNLLASDNAVTCAQSMIRVINEGINPVLAKSGYPELAVKIGVDFGKNMIVRYGSDKKTSHVDLLGPSMNVASKIQGLAKPQQILIGEDVYNKIHPTLQKKCTQEILSEAKWKYRYRNSDKLYPIYHYAG